MNIGVPYVDLLGNSRRSTERSVGELKLVEMGRGPMTRLVVVLFTKPTHVFFLLMAAQDNRG